MFSPANSQICCGRARAEKRSQSDGTFQPDPKLCGTPGSAQPREHWEKPQLEQRCPGDQAVDQAGREEEPPTHPGIIRTRIASALSVIGILGGSGGDGVPAINALIRN